MKIAIDAGHGGHDTGAVGPTGLKESHTNLDIALQLGYLLDGLNWEVLQTRTSDYFVSLSARCELANHFKADYFISIHCNSDGQNAKGIETLVYSQNSLVSKLAEAVQAELLKAIGDTDRGIKTRPDLAVLKGTQMPAILCEVGFISNPTYEKLFKEADFRQKIAQAICNGLKAKLVAYPPTIAQ
jgi:N-acetylmuramoyl-L-alanine amidase